MGNVSYLIFSGIGSALVTGAVSVWIFWRQSKLVPAKQRNIRDAWQAQSKELDERLSRQWAERATQYEKQIAYLEAQVENYQRHERGAHD